MLQQRLELQIGRLVVENQALAEKLEELTKELEKLKEEKKE